MIRKVFRGIYHFTVYAIGILVLTAAVVVTLIRLLLPDIGIYRGEVEAWVSHYMGYPVVIHSVDATWEGWVPHLLLRDIDLLNKAGTQPITHFDAAQIRIAPLATLLKRRITPKQLTINGFELAIARLGNGAIYIEGINISDPQLRKFENNELAEWLFKQEQVKIENGRIEWLDVKHGQEAILLTDVSIELRSDGKRLQAEGSTRLPEPYGKNMDFSFDATGDLMSSNWSAELYMAGHDINPEHWYSAYRPLNLNISGGNANIKVWSRWQQARLFALEGELQYDDFSTSVGSNDLHIKELAYHFSGERIDEDGWQFHLNLDHLLTENGNWPETSIVISATRDNSERGYRYSASFNYLKLDDLSPFLGSLTFLPEELKAKMADFAIHGELSQGKLIFDPERSADRRLHFDTRFSGIKTEFGPALPGVENLSGQVYGYPDHGVIALHTREARLSLDPLANDTKRIDTANGAIRWSRNAHGWKLSSNDLQIKSPQLSAQLSGSISKETAHTSPFIDLLVAVDESDLEVIPAYLPYTERFKFRDWMKNSVLGGRLISANAVFRGYLADFPFDEHNGRFKLIADTADATLDYSSLWPPIDNIDAEIAVDGREMRAKFSHGKIFDAGISAASATIADIFSREKSIALAGHINGSTRDLGLFIEQSPLQKNRSLQEISRSLLGGTMTMDLDLDIPIKQPGKTVAVAGNMTLSNSVLKSPVKNLQLDDVNGDISFTRQSVKSGVMSATFSSAPVNLVIAGSTTQADNPPSIKVSGTVNEGFVADRLLEYFPALESLEHYLRERMKGETEWILTLTNVAADTPESNVRKLAIESRLNGVEIDFPSPLGKPHYRSRPLQITSYLGLEQGSNVQIKYADILDAELLMDSKRKLRAINMHVGAGSWSFSDDPGLHIAGSVDELVADKWWEILKESRPGGAGSRGSLLQSGVYINLNVAELELLHHRFADVGLAVRRPQEYWDFTLKGADISGAIRIPVDRQKNKLISFKLDRLGLHQAYRYAGENRAESLSPADIPAIEGQIAEFVYHEFELGSLTLKTKPLARGLSIEQLVFNKPDLEITSSGTWSGNENGSTSNFKVELHASDMETMLTTFGYQQSPVKDGETQLSLAAEWKGSPMEFSLEKMNGQMNMKISKGQMLDINPAVGRLFGLFSLQTLSRRLTLDFSDIFGKGLAFDRIEGNFAIDRGNAYTNDLYMSGPSANIAISGRTGLSEQDYDQVVTVIPQFSDNLPVAGVLLGPVGIGIGAVFYLAGQMFDSIHDSIDKLLRYQYTITGSWTEPVIEKVKNKNPTSS